MFQLPLNPQCISGFMSESINVPAQTAQQSQGLPDTQGPQLARVAAKPRLPAAGGG